LSALDGTNGRVVWGARTLRRADESSDEYKYLPVRRLALFLEESLYRGTQWVMLKASERQQSALTQINVVLNWFSELQQRVPVK